MSKIRTFSSDEGWNCLDRLLEKLPRSIDTSGAIRLSIEKFLETLEKKPFVSLDNFKTETTTPDLNSDNKIWKELTKKMEVVELRDLQKLITRKKSIVDDEIYRRTL